MFDGLVNALSVTKILFFLAPASHVSSARLFWCLDRNTTANAQINDKYDFDACRKVDTVLNDHMHVTASRVCGINSKTSRGKPPYLYHPK